MNALQVTLASLLVCCVTFGGTIPTPQDDAQTSGLTSSGSTSTSTSTSNAQGHSQVMSSSHVFSAQNGYVVKVSESQLNNECKAKLSIIGNGISKTADYPCGQAPVDIINQNSSLVVGDEWFSDQPKTLVHLSGNSCQKEVFTEENGKFSSTSETLSDQECQKIHTKISELKEQQKKWNEWMAQQQLAAQQQFQQMQQNLQWFQNQLFGGLFGGK